MDLAALEAVKAITPVLSVYDVSGPDRTLVYGYDVDRNTIHIYLQGGIINYVQYKHPTILLRHESGTQLDAELCRPNKRVYPARTDQATAEAMARIGFPLCFTTYREEEKGFLNESGFYGPTIEELRSS